MLKEYINDVLRKGIIKELKLLIVNSILWVLKVENLVRRFCVDYYKFNKLIIMNYYLLFLIYKL